MSRKFDFELGLKFNFIILSSILFSLNTAMAENVFSQYHSQNNNQNNNTLNVSSSISSKVSLQNAIQTALSNNPRTQANALRLQAAFEQVSAYKQTKMLPSLSTNYSQDPQNSKSKYGSISLNMNIFNGFADEYRIQAQTCQYKKMEASYNSTNTMIQNTSGQIVGLVADGYINLVNIRSNIDFYKANLITLNNNILPFAKNAEQKNSIENFISSLEISLQESESSLKISEANYKFVVNSDVPQSTDTLSEVMDKIEIPQTADESFETSLNKSPEILTARLALDCQNLSQKADTAQLYAPRVDLSVGQSTDFNGQNTTSAMITVSKSFDIGQFTSHSANAKNISAAQLDLDGTVAEVKNNLNKNYIRLESSETIAESYLKNFMSTDAKIKTLIENIKNLTVEEMNILINLMGSRHGQWQMISMKKQDIINIKFSIQRSIGTLFETNKLTDQLIINN